MYKPAYLQKSEMYKQPILTVRTRNCWIMYIKTTLQCSQTKKETHGSICAQAFILHHTWCICFAIYHTVDVRLHVGLEKSKGNVSFDFNLVTYVSRAFAAGAFFQVLTPFLRKYWRKRMLKRRLATLNKRSTFGTHSMSHLKKNALKHS